MSQKFYQKIHPKIQMRKAWSSLAIALGLVLSTAGAAHADDLKIGVVDMQKALQTVEAGKKAKASLEGQFNAKKAELQKEEAAIKKMGEEFKKQALVMNDEARQKKQAELQERIMRFQEQTGRAQAEIQEKERKLTEPIIVRLRSIIGEVAKSKGYTMVLEKNENTVIYSQEQNDLTSEVIARYNKAPNKG